MTLLLNQLRFQSLELDFESVETALKVAVAAVFLL